MFLFFGLVLKLLKGSPLSLYAKQNTTKNTVRLQRLLSLVVEPQHFQTPCLGIFMQININISLCQEKISFIMQVR